MQREFDDLKAISRLLLKGQVILCPTDTIWGLSCNAMDDKAVQKIYTIKKRDKSKKLILLVNSVKELKRHVRAVHPRIETLIHFCTRPLTIIYDASPDLAKHLVSEKGTVAIRVTREPDLCELIQELNQPLVSTSANRQAKPFPRTFTDIDKNIINQVDYVFRSGRESNNNKRPSLIIKCNEEGELLFIR